MASCSDQIEANGDFEHKHGVETPWFKLPKAKFDKAKHGR